MRAHPLNLGLADQLAALRWVQAEIAAFGGDPARVTVFGQSAGGNTVAALLAHPEAPALFSRAIIQSGPLTAQPAKKAGQDHRQDCQGPEDFSHPGRLCPDHACATFGAQARVTAGSNPITGGAGYTLALDPALVPASPFDALTSGAGAEIPLLIGTTTDEARLWLVPSGLVMKLKGVHLALARRKVGISAAAVMLFKRNRPHSITGEILGALATDKMLRVPVNQLADARLNARHPRLCTSSPGRAPWSICAPPTPWSWVLSLTTSPPPIPLGWPGPPPRRTSPPKCTRPGWTLRSPGARAGSPGLSSGLSRRSTAPPIPWSSRRAMTSARSSRPRPVSCSALHPMSPRVSKWGYSGNNDHVMETFMRNTHRDHPPRW